ncbi:MAG: glycoside hydrolase family 25 protein [Oscillospiraceae bacterium]|nr:glycoside hydrolase family 25 protein [Oscillospiraceae bacterium]
MNTRLAPNRIKRAVLITVIALIITALIWAVASLVVHLMQYAEGSTVGQAPVVEGEVVEDDGFIPGLPRSTYDGNAFFEVDGYVGYTGKQRTESGIDVSFHQGEIDWQKVKAAGVDFAMIRVGNRGYTKGTVELDPYFLRNMDGALAAGLDVGVYFFSQAISAEEAMEEAEFVLNWIDGYDLAYPVVFDWEDIEAEARTDGMDSVTLTACAKAFCETIAAEGYEAGVYFNQRFGYQEMDLTQLLDYTFWLAEYNVPPTFLYHFDMWQYSCTGKIDGVDTVVDLNLRFFAE